MDLYMLSSFDDNILHRILECLSTKEAVQTCVLAKRWKHVWASVSSLKFLFVDFMNNFTCDNHTAHKDCSDCSERFIRFVEAVLHGRKPLDLDVLHLFCSDLVSDEQLRDWIHYAVTYHIRVLHFSHFHPLPNCIYTCTSIKEHLYRCQVHVAETVNLPKLTKLVMYSMEHIDFPKNLLSGCPVLEYLELKYCAFDECVIDHEHLRYLLINDCSVDKLLIDAPNLLSFSFLSDYGEPPQPPNAATLNMPSLFLACLQTSGFRKRENLEVLLSMLTALSNVELLKLHIYCDLLKELGGLHLHLPIFHKLKNVAVAFCPLACFEMVAWILKSSPNLKKLTRVEQPFEYWCPHKRSPFEREATTGASTDASSVVPIILSKKLEMIEVKCEKRSDHIVRKLVDELIDSTKESKNLKIHLSEYKLFSQYFE